MRTRRFVLPGTLALLAAVVLVPAAQARPGPRDGIAHSKAASITIDPRVKPYMARAPLGSCANDPTLAKCPPIHAVVFRVTTGLARFAQIPQCAVNLGDDPSSPYKAAGYAQADGKNYCTSRVTWQELDVSLFKYYEAKSGAKWFLMALKTTGEQPTGKTIRKSARWNCDGSPYRAWHAQAVGYDLMDGILYAGTQDQYNNLYCG
jgi:hypothetical protein